MPPTSPTPRLHSLLAKQLKQGSALVKPFSQPPAAPHPTPSLRSKNRSKHTSTKWKGSSEYEHTVPRVKRGDETDPETEAAGKAMKEREVDYGVKEDDLPQGVTERGGIAFAREGKEEFPKAPEPVIGENDEIGRVSFTTSRH